ncbi:MAG TPA: CO dehydrogenase/acetyl-CoA synthase complex subunit epsilon, partial [Euryarchaeota archaeon]|nr:CO dehydrogenase/acetyl-CoA synthase complex subunit epsilon [Euryarchaeota archaeon]
GVEYAKNEIFHLTSSLHAGMEGSYLDRESKAMHAGLMDNLLMEIGDITQIATYNFPKGVIDVPLVQLGPGTVDKKKPVITCIGHNVMPAAEVISYLEDMDLMDDVEVCGICCTAHDMARRNKNVKIVGNLSKQLKFIGTGISDVVMLDEQCVREDIIDVARNYGTVVIATNDKVCLGLDDRTGDSVEAIVEDLATGKAEGVLILDAVTAGHVAVQTAQRLSETRKKRDTGLLSSKEIKEWAGKCTSCEACLRTCPVDIHISDFMKDAKEGNFASFVDAKELCVGCMRCDYACETGIPITHVMDSAARNYTENYVGNVRMGRGPITDVEIRNVGRPLVFGEIPGIVVFAGCSNVPNSEREIAVMAEEFLKRNFIVVTTGCAAMSLGSYKDEEGKTLYDKYPGEFDAGGLTNLGSCVSNAHALGAAIKVAHIFAKRPLRGNFEEVADYIHNRVGVVAVVWGTYSQKAHAICTGLARWGIPVLYGPSGMGYTRLLVGRKDKPETFKGFDARSGDEVILDMCPDELITIAENMEEAIVKIARNVMRPNDGAKGRVIKISHYMDIHKKYFGTVPDDLHLYIRNEKDIPITMKDEVMAILEKTDWVEKAIPDPTMVERLVRK